MTLYHCGYKSNELACIKEQLKSAEPAIDFERTHIAFQRKISQSAE
jgi:hypothetical protein